MYNDKKNVIEITNLGKMYKLYKKNSDKVMDAFGLNFWRKNYYQEYWALRDVNIQIKKGERVGIIGHNGAGKSTLLKMIIGNLEPTEGTIAIEGKIQALMELGTGFHPDFTGKENIRASLAYNGLTQAEIRKKETEIIDFAELGDYIEQPVKTYSAGMYARLAFSTATAIEPEVLIIDEVLGAGDAYFAGKSIERMKQLTSNENATVLFVSHDFASVQALCERIIWIDKGRIRYDGDALTAIKGYSDAVREKQENKLRIRDRKVQEKQALVLDKEEELYQSFLFRFRGNDELKALIRRIEMYKNDKIIAELDIGMPMDNDLTSHNHILDDKTKMCWETSEKDNNGYFRYIDISKGKYKHAPFVFSIGRSEDIDKEYTIKIYGEIKSGDDLELSVFDKKSGEYKNLYVFKRGCKLEEQSIYFCLDKDKNRWEEEKSSVGDLDSAKMDAENKSAIEFQDSDECQITNAGIYDKDMIKRQVFAFENPISYFDFKISFSREVNQFSFAFLIFTMRGDMVISQCQDVKGGMGKEYDIKIRMKDLRLGSGMYTISFGVYTDLDVIDDSKPQSAIALIDRGMSFEIERPLNYRLGVGNVLPNLEIDVLEKRGEEYVCSSKI